MEPESLRRAPETLSVEAAAVLACVLSVPPSVVDVERVKGTPAESEVMERTAPEALAVTASTRLGSALMAAARFVAIAPRVVSFAATV